MTAQAAALVGSLAAMWALAAVAPLIERRLGRETGYVLAAALLILAGLLGVVARDPLTGAPTSAEWRWKPSLEVAFSLRLDGLAWLFCLLVLGVGALIFAYCARYLPEDEPHGIFYAQLTAFGAAMLGLVLAGDMVLLFVFWEYASRALRSCSRRAWRAPSTAVTRPTTVRVRDQPGCSAYTAE
ncbi:hypothetical protein FNX44_025505, partial [Streptomyces sp. OF1]|nr:hypothetical protein [Streptomyces alkaliterrae]